MKNMKVQILLFALILIFISSCSSDVNIRENTNVNISRPSIPTLNNEAKIGNQIWMTKNLNVSRYRNGDIIPEVQDTIQWANLTTGAWCYYRNNPENGNTYGKLYNWYAVNDSRGLAPNGWHVASYDEWSQLRAFLGGEQVAGGKLKEIGTTHWLSPNTGASNSTGFTCLPSGYRTFDGSLFRFLKTQAFFWSSSGYDNGTATLSNIFYSSAAIGITGIDKKYGFAVRCIKN